jgi:hypothetical protein
MHECCRSLEELEACEHSHGAEVEALLLVVRAFSVTLKITVTHTEGK